MSDWKSRAALIFGGWTGLLLSAGGVLIVLLYVTGWLHSSGFGKPGAPPPNNADAQVKADQKAVSEIVSKVAVPQTQDGRPKITIPPPPKFSIKKVTPPKIADTPDGMVKQLGQALADGKPEMLWFMLPPSYQKDVQGLISSVADKMDPDLWHLGFHGLRQFFLLLETRKSFFANHFVLERLPMAKDQVLVIWDPMVRVGKTLSASEICSLDELKKLDVGTYLAGSGAAVWKDLVQLGSLSPLFKELGEIARYGNAKATVLSQEGDVAVVEVELPGRSPVKVDFMRVEDRWLPKDFVEEWPDAMKTARDYIAGFKIEEQVKKKDELLPQLNMIGAVSDSLRQQATQEDFNKSIQFALVLASIALRQPDLAKPPETKKPDAKAPADGSEKAPASKAEEKAAPAKPQAAKDAKVSVK